MSPLPLQLTTLLPLPYAPHSNDMGYLSLPEASLHYLHTCETMRQFKYHILEFPMTNIFTIEGCIMKWEGAYAPHPPPPPGAFECGSIINIYQPYLEAIPSKFHVSIIIIRKTLISFTVLAKISTWKGGWGNISTPYISNFSYLIILLYFYHPPITL